MRIRIDGANPIKTFREYRGLTQAKLAKLTNLSVVMIKKLESGETKESLKSLKAIAKALILNIQDILED